MHRYEEVETEMGRLWIGCSPKGIAMVTAAAGTGTAFENAYERLTGVRPEKGTVPAHYKRALVRAAAGRDFEPVPVDFSGLSAFHTKVLTELRKVPRGEVRTYSWLARKVGRPLAARAVGTAMARNPVPFLVPCHRVVPASGGTGNFGLGKARKRDLLRREGVDVERL